MTILLLFGAGASTGAIGLNKNPPLGKDLFNELCKNYPDTWGNTIPSTLVDLFKADFESAMELLHKQEASQTQYNTVTLLRNMALFFSEFQILNKKTNLYCLLIKKYSKQISANKIILSTLNYECLIEIALWANKINFDYAKNSRKPKLLKPHGSCNFIPQGIKGGSNGLTINIGTSKLICPIVPVMPEKVKDALDNMFMPVAMSLFTRAKTNIIAPNYIQIVLNEFQNTIKNVSAIISVGVRPNPDDVHIWKPIAESQAKVFLLADEQECTNWIKEYRSEENTFFIGNRFNDSLEDIYSVIDDNL